ncbi:FAD dependent oxidoreductase [Aspergillus campestris IBT 28561]|uniref:FAD dependent oxidoreductase n=1 Tax=Aspergillus campestris (strain IBT 28561) TaxID=1392248 RepID=A0A2I1DBZ9_ASPC2|nr:FAD dependent oxidoreductase [Aspergillus campestris IBT 28561]PKY07393.1 FAD dependent oxidoreductase [Aspergillus campestris IBT 28561]
MTRSDLSASKGVNAAGDGIITLEATGDNHPAVDISVHQDPLVKPKPSSKHIIIIGGGVNGLMTAWVLLDKGYRVTILAKEWAWTQDWQNSRITSQIAGALWEYPQGGCGLKEIDVTEPGWSTKYHYREWTLQAYEFYHKMNTMQQGRMAKEFGVGMVKINLFFYHDLNKENEFNAEDYEKFHMIREDASANKILGFEKYGPERVQQIVESLGSDDAWKRDLRHGYGYDAPNVDSDRAMVFLMSIVASKGAQLETRELKGKPLSEFAKDFKDNMGADAIINATGLGAGELVGDPDVFPVRGALIRIDNNKRERFEPLHEACIVPAQMDADGLLRKGIWLFPRVDGTLIVGALAQPANDVLNLTQNSPEIGLMWKRARSFLPAIGDARTVPHYPLAQGLRPFTKRNVKVRADLDIDQLPVVHNYGHGGSGWALAPGTARTTVHLLELMLNEGYTGRDANRQYYGCNPGEK